MAHPIRVALAALVTVTVLGACGGGDDTSSSEAAQLRDEVEDLKRQLETTTTTPPTTTPTTAAVTPAPVAAPTPVAPAAPVKQPQGTLEWQDLGRVPGDQGLGPPCSLNQYKLINRSDTAILNITIKGAYKREWNDAAPNGVLDTMTFPPQTIAAGVPAFGETMISAKWCSDALSPGSDSFFAMHDKATISWRWVQ